MSDVVAHSLQGESDDQQSKTQTRSPLVALVLPSFVSLPIGTHWPENEGPSRRTTNV